MSAFAFSTFPWTLCPRTLDHSHDTQLCHPDRVNIFLTWVVSNHLKVKYLTMAIEQIRTGKRMEALTGAGLARVKLRLLLYVYALANPNTVKTTTYSLC